jgi:hypothetical protein
LDPRDTWDPVSTRTADKYETETLNPETGSMVTVRIPATEPAKMTFPDTGARTSSPVPAA